MLGYSLFSVLLRTAHDKFLQFLLTCCIALIVRLTLRCYILNRLFHRTQHPGEQFFYLFDFRISSLLFELFNLRENLAGIFFSCLVIISIK